MTQQTPPNLALSLVHATINDLQEDRDKWRSLSMKLGLTLTIMTILLVGMMAAFLLFRPATYFSTSPTGQITRLVPLNKPTVTSTAAQRFALNTVTESLSLNFRQWKSQLAAVEPKYTTEGYRNFLSALDKRQWIKFIEAGFYTATTIETARPVIVSQGINPRNGIYGYEIEVPMTLLLENREEKKRQELTVRIRVVRVPTTENVDGIAVDNVSMG